MGNFKPTPRMRNKILIFLLLLTSLTACGQKKMEQKFFTWDNFVDGFGNEMVSAEDVFNNMVKSGLKDNCLTKMDFTFISDKKENFYQNHFFDTTSTHDKLVYKPISFTSKLELKNNYSDTKSNFLGFLGYNGILSKVSQNDIDSTYYISNIFWGSGLQYRSKFGLFYIGDFTFLRNPDTYNHFNHSIFLYYFS